MGSHVKLAIIVIVGLAIVLLILTFAVGPNPNAASFNILVCCSGIAMGWFAGFLSSPLDNQEIKKFSAATKIVSAFISGYILSKFDSLLAIAKESSIVVDRYFVARLLFFTCCFILSALLVYYLRAYDARPEAPKTKLSERSKTA